MSNSVEFVDGDMTEEDRKKIDELLIKIAKEKELAEKIEKLKEENDVSFIPFRNRCGICEREELHPRRYDSNGKGSLERRSLR